VPSYVKAYATEIQRARSGREQRRTVGLPQRTLSFDTIPLEQADRRAVFDFLASKSGSLSAFYLFNPIPESITSYAAGTVSSATSFTLPWKGPWWVNQTPVAATISAMTINGDAVTPTSVTPNVGSGGEDSVAWSGSKSGAVVITATLVRHRIQVRNYSDDITQDFLVGAADAHAIFPLRFLELI
jgi:hypothetical protein